MKEEIFTLKGNQRSYLKKLAHHLKPIVMIGQAGLSVEVVSAADQALKSHELIKVKFQDFKQDRRSIAEDMASRCRAEFIALVGNTLVLFRHNYEKEERIRLPK